MHKFKRLISLSITIVMLFIITTYSFAAGMYVDGVYNDSGGNAMAIVSDGKITEWKLNPKKANPSSDVDWDDVRMIRRATMVLRGFLLDESGNILVKTDPVKMYCPNLFNGVPEGDAELAAKKQEVKNKLLSLSQSINNEKIAVLETYLEDVKIAEAYSDIFTKYVFVKEGSRVFKLPNGETIILKESEVKNSIKNDMVGKFSSLKSWKVSHPYSYETEVEVPIPLHFREMELDCRRLDDPSITIFDIPDHYTTTKTFSSNQLLMGNTTYNAINSFLSSILVPFGDDRNVTIKYLYKDPSGVETEIKDAEKFSVSNGMEFEHTAPESIIGAYTGEKYVITMNKYIKIDSVTEDKVVKFYYNKLGKNGIYPVLVGVPSPSVIRVKKGATSAIVDITLDAHDSSALINGVRKEIDSFRFWLGDFNTEGQGTKANSYKYEKYKINFPSIREGETKKVLVPAQLKVWSRGLQDYFYPDNTKYIAYTTINVEVTITTDGTGPIPIPQPGNPGQILYKPNSSTEIASASRGYWTNKNDVKVTYRPSYTPDRREPNSGEYSRSFSIDYRYTWKEYIDTVWVKPKYKTVTTGEGENKKTEKVLVRSGYWKDVYSSESETKSDNVTVAGYWDLNKINVEGTGLSGSRTIDHNDTIHLVDGKNLQVNGEAAYWDKHPHWRDSPTKPSSPSSYGGKDYGLSGSWRDSTSSSTQFERKFPSPSVPNWTGSSGGYNIDTVDPVAKIISPYQTGVWYGGRKQRVLTINGDVRDDRSGIYDGTLRNVLYDMNGNSRGDQYTVYNQVLESTSTQRKSITLSRSGKHLIKLSVEDNAGNNDYDSEGKYLLDNTDPDVRVGVSEMGWVNQEIGIPITFTDEHSGVDQMGYEMKNISKLLEGKNELVSKINLGKFDKREDIYEGDELRKVEQDIKINKDGIYEITTDVTYDAVGNDLPSQKFGPYKYDATHPNIKLTFDDTKLYNQRIEFTADQRNVVNVEVSDNLSGVAKLEYALTESNKIPSKWKLTDISTKEDTLEKKVYMLEIHEGKAEWDKLKSGLWFLHIRLTDRAGNVISMTGDVGKVPDVKTVDDCVIDYTKVEEGVRVKEFTAIPIFINKVGESDKHSKDPDPNLDNPNTPMTDDMFTSDLRIIKITDPTWKNTLKHDYIFTDEMAVYSNKVPSKIKLGYAADFELDTVGYGKNTNDSIEIGVRQFVKTPKGYKEVELYIPQYKNSAVYNKVKQDSMYKFIKLLRKGKTIKNDDDNFMVIGNSNDEKYRWSFSYFIRPDVKLVFKNNSGKGTLNINNAQDANKILNTKVYPEMLVVMDIKAKKEYGKILNYTKKEDKWGDNKGSQPTKYGYKKSTGLDLIGVGRNKGEVLWFETTRTNLDDLEGETHYQGE